MRLCLRNEYPKNTKSDDQNAAKIPVEIGKSTEASSKCFTLTSKPNTLSKKRDLPVF